MMIWLISLLLFTAISNAFGTQLSFHNDNFIVDYTQPSSSEIEFTLKVKTTGWVAIGISSENTGMKKLDLFIGGYKNGAGYLKDYNVDGKTAPNEDSVLDVILVSASENNGLTTLQFKRKLNTGDGEDNVIQVDTQYYLAWAYGTSDTIGWHGNANRGYSNLVKLASSVLPTTTAAVSSIPSTVASSTITASTSSVAPSATSTPSVAPSATSTSAPSSVAPTSMPSATTTSSSSSVEELRFHQGNYLLNWKYDADTREITFKLAVKALGWIGLGISEVNTGMKKMDTAVVMVNSSGYGTVQDYYSEETTKPVKDGRQDFKLLTSSQKNGTTTAEIKRKLKTDDEKDIEIVVGKSYYIAWAYHKTSSSFVQHDSRGYHSQKVVLVSTQTTTAPGAAGHGTCATLFGLVLSLTISTIALLGY